LLLVLRQDFLCVPSLLDLESSLVLSSPLTDEEISGGDGDSNKVGEGMSSELDGKPGGDDSDTLLELSLWLLVCSLNCILFIQPVVVIVAVVVVVVVLIGIEGSIGVECVGEVLVAVVTVVVLEGRTELPLPEYVLVEIVD